MQCSCQLGVLYEGPKIISRLYNSHYVELLHTATGFTMNRDRRTTKWGGGGKLVTQSGGLKTLFLSNSL